MDIKRLLHRIGMLPESGGRALGRGIGLAAVVGVVAGLGAIVFHLMCLVITHFALTQTTGYEQGGPTNETELHQIIYIEHGEEKDEPSIVPWLLILVPAAGGLVSGFIVFKFAPEAEGHGTDAAIRAYHHDRGLIRARVPIVKMISSAITLGTGGSGGREGPIAQIGAGFGSFLATRLQLSDSERRMLMAAGLGAGIGAIFHAPLAGAIFAIEVMYRDPDFEAEALIPAFIATSVAYSVFSLAFGVSAFKPLFHVAPDMTFTKPLELMLPLAVLAVIMVIAAFAYTKCFYSTHNLFKKWKISPFLKPMIGGTLTGVVALILYFSMSGGANNAQHDSLSVLSFGYGFLQKVLHPGGAPIAIGILLVVGIGKILTTALTIGSGGSGGVFGPSMVIGGALGSVVGTVFHYLFPGVVAQTDIVIFAILGMASFFAAAANTPVSTLIMVSEMTASYVLLLPSMWVCALAYLVKGKWTLYEEQVGSRLDSPAHRSDFIVDVLKGMTVRDALAKTERKFITVSLDTPLPELSKLVTTTTQTSFAVVNDDGNYYGLFSLQDIRQFLYEGQVGLLAVAQDLATPNVEPLALQLDLSSAITRFAQERFEELPVVDDADPTTVIGTLRRQDVISVYEKRLMEVQASPNPRASHAS